MNSRKATAAVILGAVGVLALGACSSGSDQAQPDREAEAASSSTPATATPTGERMAVPQGGDFKGVWITKAPDTAKCENPKEKDGHLTFYCEEIDSNVFGDPVFVGVPSDKFRISVARMASADHTLYTIQRDQTYGKVHQSQDEHTVWNSPYSDPDFKARFQWGVGLSAEPLNKLPYDTTSAWVDIERLQ